MMNGCLVLSSRISACRRSWGTGLKCEGQRSTVNGQRDLPRARGKFVTYDFAFVRPCVFALFRRSPVRLFRLFRLYAFPPFRLSAFPPFRLSAWRALSIGPASGAVK